MGRIGNGSNGTAQSDELDTDGRSPGAEGWRGDLHSASDAALQAHEKGVARAIANLTVTWCSADRSWRISTAQERDEADMEKWVHRLLEVRREMTRRETEGPHEASGSVPRRSSHPNIGSA